MKLLGLSNVLQSLIDGTMWGKNSAHASFFFQVCNALLNSCHMSMDYQTC